ncbi:MAG: PAS domain S-box protein [Gemmatimonadota bacterium]
MRSGDQDLLDALMRVTESLVVVLDVRGRIIRFNPACELVTGYTFDEVEGRHFWDFLLAPEAIKPARAVFRRLRSGSFPIHHENDWLIRDGGARRIRWSNTVLVGDDGNVTSVVATGRDVTSERLTEDALRESNRRLAVEESLRRAEAKFSGIVSASSDAIIMTDDAQRITLFNAGAEKVFGYTAGEITGRPLETLLPEGFRTAHDQHLGRFAASATESRSMGEHRTIYGRRRNGQEFPAEVSISKIKSGRGWTFVAVLRDVTDRIAIEEALRNGEATIRELHEITSAEAPGDMKIEQLLEMGCRRLKLDMGILSRIEGERYEVLAAYPPDGEVTAGDVFDLAETYCRVAVASDEPLGFERASAYQSHPCYTRFGLEAYLGMAVYVRGRAHGTLNFSSPNPRERAFTPTERDTLGLMAQWIGGEIERKQAEDAQSLLARAGTHLASSLDVEQLLDSVARLMVPSLADWCVVDVVTDDGAVRPATIIAADPRKEELLREMLLRYPHHRERGAIGQVLRSGEPILLETISDTFLQTVAEEPEHLAILRLLEPCSAMFVPLRVRGQLLGVMVFTAAESARRYDARDLALAGELAHRAALALHNAQLYEEAQAAITERERMMEVVSHDLRSPLHVIHMTASMLKKEVQATPSSEKLRKRVDVIGQAADQMERLIQDLLDVARIEAGEFSVVPRAVAAEDLVEDALALLGPIAEARGILLERDLDRQLSSVLADRDRVLQVFSNLVGNATRLTPAGGRVTISGTSVGDALRFSISDTGPGMSPDEIPRVFDRFWQAKKGEGAGLGLSIVRGIVEAHGGNVSVESQVGAGSTFHFTLPCS